MKTQIPYNFNASVRARKQYYKTNASRWPRPAILTPPACNTRQQFKLFVESLRPFNTTDANRIDRQLPEGWYADIDQFGIIIPAVVQYRTNTHDDDKRRYLAATYSNSWDGATIFTDIHYTTASEAAHAANQHAEREAQDCFDYDLKDQVALHIERYKDEYHITTKNTLETIRALKTDPPNNPTICRVIRKSIEDALDRRKQILAEIAKLDADPYILLPR